MKLSALYRPGLWCLGIMAIAGVGVAVKAVTGAGPDALDTIELERHFEAARPAAERLWAGLENNPAPLLLAALTFALTFVYHVARGRSVRDAIDAATVRTPHVVHVSPVNDQSDAPAVAKAKARALRVQLVADQIRAENRLRELTRTGTGRDEGEIKRAEGNASHTQQALANARRNLAEKEQAHAEAAGKLASLNAERVKLAREVEEIGMAMVVVGAQV